MDRKPRNRAEALRRQRLLPPHGRINPFDPIIIGDLLDPRNHKR